MTSGWASVARGTSAFLRLIRFSHTLFALPYAVTGALLGVSNRGGFSKIPWSTLPLVVLCMVTARTAAMTFNRWVDRRYDALNPRTRGRPSVTGEVAPRTMVVVTVVASAAFVAAAYGLNPLCGALSPIALATVLGYSFMKRVGWACHLVLGVALGLSPIGAYLAVGGAWDIGTVGIVAMGVAVCSWTAGFDVIYACQDADHDRALGLHSIPARFGVAGALTAARGFHAFVPPALAFAGGALGLGTVYFVGVVAVMLLLVYEHRLVKADDLRAVDTAFFTVNVAISLLVLATSVADLWIGGRL
jgi:4-hydroxybenzoate polyprenyltransferase